MSVLNSRIKHAYVCKGGEGEIELNYFRNIRMDSEKGVLSLSCPSVRPSVVRMSHWTGFREI